MGFSKISRIHIKITFVGISFLIKLQTSGKDHRFVNHTTEKKNGDTANGQNFSELLKQYELSG